MATEAAIKQVRDEIEDAIRELSDYIGKDYSFRLDDIREHLFRAKTALTLLTADAPDAVAALPGQWREEAITLRQCRERERERGTGRDMFHVYGAKAAQCDDCARQLDVAMKGEK